jgi:beta-xylosidase
MKENCVTLQEIRIRDPYILPVAEEGRYYLYGTTDSDPWYGKGEGFRVWWSEDLTNWQGGTYAFQPEQGFWATHHFWSPEVHVYRQKYYMLASFKREDRCRAVHVLVSEKPEGPFVPVSEAPITPLDWECLDGTLYFEGNIPYLVFCHEWTQIQNGTICAARLSSDLTKMVTKPMLLFRASEAPWSISDTGAVMKDGEGNYVTDGPYLYRADGKLLMLWSSNCKTGYGIGVAYSESGSITGPWRQCEKPLFEKDGGHGMLFSTFAGETKLVFHAPNRSPLERAVFLDVIPDPQCGMRLKDAAILASDG